MDAADSAGCGAAARGSESPTADGLNFPCWRRISSDQATSEPPRNRTRSSATANSTAQESTNSLPKKKHTQPALPTMHSHLDKPENLRESGLRPLSARSSIAPPRLTNPPKSLHSSHPGPRGVSRARLLVQVGGNVQRSEAQGQRVPLDAAAEALGEQQGGREGAPRQDQAKGAGAGSMKGIMWSLT